MTVVTSSPVVDAAAVAVFTCVAYVTLLLPLPSLFMNIFIYEKLWCCFHIYLGVIWWSDHLYFMCSPMSQCCSSTRMMTAAGCCCQLVAWTLVYAFNFVCRRTSILASVRLKYLSSLVFVIFDNEIMILLKRNFATLESKVILFEESQLYCHLIVCSSVALLL